jgi:hypothetical protein
MDDYMDKLDRLRADIDARSDDLDELNRSVERLQQIAPDPSMKTEVLEKFHSIKVPFDEMRKKIGR